MINGELPDLPDDFVEEARRMFDMVESSALSIVSPYDPDQFGVKMAIEIGAMILLDKPILVVTLPDQVLPGKLRLVADAVVEMLPDDFEETQRRMRAAVYGLIGDRLGGD